MDQTLIKLLEDIGFTEKEARVYLALLELGKGDVTDVSRIAELKRPIIYVLLEGLIKRGYASQIPGTKVKEYRAADPAMILNSLKNRTRNFAEMLPIFKSLSNKGHKRPRIHYYETLSGIWKIYEEMFYVDKANVITANARLDRYFPGVHESWPQDYERGKFKIRGRFLVPEEEKELYYAQFYKQTGQEVKTLASLKGMSMDLVIYNNKIAITSLGEDPFMVLFESEEIAASMSVLFDIAWAGGKEIEKC